MIQQWGIAASGHRMNIAASGLSPGKLRSTGHSPRLPDRLPSGGIRNLVRLPAPIVLDHNRGFDPVTQRPLLPGVQTTPSHREPRQSAIS